MENCRRVILCGASSVGKTTLVNHILTRCPHFHQIGEVARTVMAELQINQKMLIESLETDRKLFLSLQLPILQRQHEEESALNAVGKYFISDRGPDALLYCEFFGDKNISDALVKNNTFVRQMLESYRSKSSLVILVSPLPGVNVDDGTRTLMNTEEKACFTEMFRQFFHRHNIPFLDLQVTSLDARSELVLRAMQNN